jgi:hypothetical protein
MGSFDFKTFPARADVLTPLSKGITCVVRFAWYRKATASGFTLTIPNPEIVQLALYEQVCAAESRSMCEFCTTDNNTSVYGNTF